MPGPYFAYYQGVAERMVPFLQGRHVAVEQRFRNSLAPTYRRHVQARGRRQWIEISRPDDIVNWARQYAVAFHAHVRPEGPGCWFVLDIDARDLPLAMAQIAALHTLDVLAEHDLSALVKFSGSNGFHLMWNFPSLRGLGGRTIWDFERSIVRSLARCVAERLATDDRAEPVRQAVGDGPLIATSSQDHANRAALLFDEYILKPNVNVRVPYSIHAGSGLVAAPLTRDELSQFDLVLADPDHILMTERSFQLPQHDIAALRPLLARTPQLLPPS